MNTQKLVLAIVIAIGCFDLAAIARQTDATNGANWRFTDITGREHKPFDGSAIKAIVLVFISTDCPIANSYHPLLRELAHSNQSNGISWYMIHPDPATTAEQAAVHARRFQIDSPIVIDHDQSIARRVGATVTPQVFVYRCDEGRPDYAGRIDDLYADYGKKRPAATTHDLADALQAIEDGKPIAARETKAIGCFISFQESKSETPATYDPLDIDDSKIEQVVLSVDDKSRSREIPIRVYLPTEKGTAPVVLFSHGLGGNRDGSPYLGKHWAARGYVAVFLQHPGSDDSVWKDVTLLERLPAMRKAANAENFMLRAKDVPAVIDQLERWNKEKEHPLKGRMDLKRIGISGHSFGAVTTQALSGQLFLGRTTFTDPRIKAAAAMSPSAAKGANANRTFGKVAIPWLLMTGTNDVAIIGDADLESRLAVFPALPAGNKYELVLDKATHMAFSEREIPIPNLPRNPNHHVAILAITTAFWDAFLQEDSVARAWLDGEEVRKILEPADKWQKK